MKTSLGIWAFGPMSTRFAPGGYQPQWAGEPMHEPALREVQAAKDAVCDYELVYAALGA